jgi:mycothiol synthase
VPATVTTPDQLDATQVAQIQALVDSVRADEGRDPLSDQALTQLPSASVEHAVAEDGDRLVGYAQLEGSTLEVVAEPDAIAALLDTFADRPVLVWSHGERSRLAPVLSERGFSQERRLHQLRRPLDEPIDVPLMPAGVELRAFEPGRDEDEWVRVNAAAFTALPDQGGWQRADLEARERDTWFDPSGFLMAWQGDRLAGFHWTKIHPDGAGEVYVVAVDPSAQGIGLGAVLLHRGLAYLRDRGCAEVLLYVDESNTGAMRLYERNGFRRYDLDVQWRSP